MNDATESPTLRLRRLDAAAEEILVILRDRRILTMFQPIVDPRARTIYGHEALSRGPSDSWLHSPLNLFEAARRANVRVPLEFECIESAMTRLAATGAPGRLFLNVSPDAVLEAADFTERLQEAAARAKLQLDRCVVELTEESLVEDYRRLREVLERIREAGCEIAIDDLGAGRSGLRTWSELRPDYVKIDRYFISNIDSDAAKLGFVRSILDMGRAIGSRVVAEGVETEAESAELIELGVDYLQGYYFGRPEAAIGSLDEQLAALDRLSASQPALSAEHLIEHVDPVPPEMRVQDLVELFRREPKHDVRAVVKEGRPLGVVRRDDVLDLLARPLHLEIYNKKPVSAVMESPALMIDSRLKLEQVSRLVTQRVSAHVTDRFVITRDGQYVGMGQTMELLRRITEQQVQAARQSNPLTLLPGNAPIRDCLSRLVAQGQRFVVCYVDIDSFKPYNDCYGTTQGDQVILHLAGLLKSAVSSRLDFVGQVGGDDFVVVMRSNDWRRRLTNLVDNFAMTVKTFFTPEDAATGIFKACGRDGTDKVLPLLTISLAALDSGTPGCGTAEAIASQLAQVKRIAKARPGNSFLLRNSAGDFDLLSGRGEDDPRRRNASSGAG